MTSHTSLSPINIHPGVNQSYSYYIRPLSDVPQLMHEVQLRRGKCLVVTDTNIEPLYASHLTKALEDDGWDPKCIAVPAGEPTKSYKHLHDIYDVALSWGIDRKTPILALGGGVVGDLAGFAAASMLRGLPLIQLPTTLIAQVDSALGGKTGINHKAGKNLIGAFHQPAFVCADLNTLSTLPQREWTSGLAEVVKHALIADESFLAFLETNWQAIIEKEHRVIGPMVHRAAEIKAEVVTQDVLEASIRAILNFGHTFGHAIERTAGYGHYTHGEAVAVGIRMALRLSKVLHPQLDMDRCDKLVQKIPLYSAPTMLSAEALLEAMYTDKKTLAGKLRFVLLDRVGHAYVEPNASNTHAMESINDILHELSTAV